MVVVVGPGDVVVVVVRPPAIPSRQLGAGDQQRDRLAAQARVGRHGHRPAERRRPASARPRARSDRRGSPTGCRGRAGTGASPISPTSKPCAPSAVAVVCAMPVTAAAFRTFTSTWLWASVGTVVVAGGRARPLRRGRWGRSDPDLVEGVDHVLGVGLGLLQHVRAAAGDEPDGGQRLGDQVRRRQPLEVLGDVEEVTLGSRCRRWSDCPPRRR